MKKHLKLLCCLAALTASIVFFSCETTKTTAPVSEPLKKTHSSAKLLKEAEMQKIQWVDIDLSKSSMPACYDKNTKSITVKDVEQFKISLGTSLSANEKIKVKVTGETSVPGVGFRSWLVDDSFTTLTSADTLYLTANDEDFNGGKFEIIYDLKATGDANCLNFKGPVYGTNIDLLTITSVQVSYDAAYANDNSTFKADEIYDTMVSSSILNTGNNYLVKDVIQRARDGEEITLAYIGGSITEGALAVPNSRCYAEVSARLFGQKYGVDGGKNVHFINAGMSGTPSSLGIVRYERDITDRLETGDDPDMLFIEFAVNDWQECTNGGAYEGLIRKCLDNDIAVVLIFSIFKSGRVLEYQYKTTFGKHYNLPMVSMGDAIESHFKDAGFLAWYFGDSLHPNNTGHKLMADCIMGLFDRIDSMDEDDEYEIPSPLKTDAYQNMKMLSRETITDSPAITLNEGSFTEKDKATGNFQYEYKGKKGAPWFPENWMHKTDSGSESLTATVKCKTLLVIYKLSSSKKTGVADLYVDGKKVKSMSGYNTSGWNNATTELVFNDAEATEHTIEVRMADGNEEKEFTLMGFGYSE